MRRSHDLNTAALQGFDVASDLALLKNLLKRATESLLPVLAYSPTRPSSHTDSRALRHKSQTMGDSWEDFDDDDVKLPGAAVAPAAWDDEEEEDEIETVAAPQQSSAKAAAARPRRPASARRRTRRRARPSGRAPVRDAVGPGNRRGRHRARAAPPHASRPRRSPRRSTRTWCPSSSRTSRTT